MGPKPKVAHNAASTFLITPALCGCLPEQQQRLKCEFEFLQTKADTTLSDAAAPAFVAACMGRNGFVRHSSERGCEPEK